MLVPRSYTTPPTVDSTRTRRPCSGLSATGVILPTLYAQLDRMRPAVTHSVDTEILADWQTTAIPASAADPIRVPIYVSDRAERLAVAIQYRSDPLARIACRLDDMAGAALDAGFEWLSEGALAGSVVSLPTTRALTIAFPPTYTWSYGIVSTGTEAAIAAVTRPRPLLVPDGTGVPPDARGSMVQVVITSTAALSQVLSVAVYELAQDEVTP